jgi:hypothetical protein
MKKKLLNKTSLSGKFTMVWICCLVLIFPGCMLIKKVTGEKENTSFNKFTKQSAASIDEVPKQLITNFQDMKENELVSWVWMQPGFEVTRCQSIEVAPVLNYSAFTYPWAEAKILSSLQKTFSAMKKDAGGSYAVEVKSAIIDMRPQKKMISRLLPFEEDFLYMEIQLVIVDKNSQEPLCKIAHGKRSENFKEAVEGMMANVEAFFLRDVAK